MVHATIMASRRRSISAFGVVTDAPDETVHRFGILNGDDFQHLSNFNIELIQEVYTSRGRVRISVPSGHSQTNGHHIGTIFWV